MCPMINCKITCQCVSLKFTALGKISAFTKKLRSHNVYAETVTKETFIFTTVPIASECTAGTTLGFFCLFCLFSGFYFFSKRLRLS